MTAFSDCETNANFLCLINKSRTSSEEPDAPASFFETGSWLSRALIYLPFQNLGHRVATP